MADAENAAIELKNGGPRSLTRLLGLFDTLANSREGLTLADLNVALDSPKSSLLNLLRPLVAEGYLTQVDGRYRLGPAIFHLSARIMSKWSFAGVLRPYLEELADLCRETVLFGILDRAHGVITYVDVIESAKSVRYAIPIGTSRPLYCTAAGRLLLAYADKNWSGDYLHKTKLERLTPDTVTEKQELQAELDRILAQGYSVSIGELVPESAAIAAPVSGPDGGLIGALAIGVPSDRFKLNRSVLHKSVVDVAMRASGKIPKA